VRLPSGSPAAPGGDAIENWSPFDSPAEPGAAAGDLTEPEGDAGGFAVPSHLKIGEQRSVAAPPMIDLSTDLGLVIPPTEAPPRLTPGTMPAVTRPPPRNAPIEELDPNGPPPAVPVGSESGPSDPAPAHPPPKLNRGDQGGRRWQIRRKSGKVFGPFDEGTILKMLGNGELLGNEDVKTEGADWQAMSEISTFADALASGAGRAPAPEIAPPVVRTLGARPEGEESSPAVAPVVPTMYGGRMAASALVEVVDWRPRLKRLIPLAAVILLAVVLLTIGLLLGGTPYGAFGVYKIFGPPRVRASSSAGGLVAQARKGMDEGTYRAVSGAFNEAEKAQQAAPKTVEPASLMIEAAMELQRTYGESANAMPRARAAFARVQEYGKSEPEVIRAEASQLIAQNPTGARPALEALLRREPSSAEDLYLLALTYASSDRTRELSTLKLMAQAAPHSGKAYYALGDLAADSGDLDEALTDFRKAKEIDPSQDRAVLREVEIALRRDQNPTEAEAILRALKANAQTTLGPNEQATAEALIGLALLRQGKPKEAEAAFRTALESDRQNASAQLNLGRFLASKRRYKEALDILTPAVAAHKQSVDLVIALAEVQVSLGHYEDASKALASAYATHPNDSKLATLQGIAQASLGKADEAEKLLTAALKADPNSVEARLAMGRLHQGRGDLAAAKADFQAAVEHNPQSARAHASLGIFLLQTKDQSGAAPELTRAVALDDGNAEAHSALGQLALQQNQKAVARTQLLKAEALDPGQPGLRLMLGTLLLELGEYPAAQARFEAVINDVPEDYMAQIRLGEAFLAQGKTDDALTALKRAQALAPNSGELHAQMARALIRKGEGPKALLEAKDAVDAQPNYPDAWLAQGLVQLQIGEFVGAKRSFQKAIELQPTYPEAWELLGNTLVGMEDLRGAIVAYEKSKQQDPSRQRLALTIGDLQIRIKDYHGALASYLDALKNDPKLVGAYYLIGRAYDLQGKAGEAAKYYEKATIEDVQNPMPYKYLGYYYKALGRNSRALAAFQTYLKRKPDADDKDVILEEIGFLKGE
jgi:tetratricopeptide (TPR) repeat protein